jgi:hypothetical protein
MKRLTIRSKAMLFLAAMMAAPLFAQQPPHVSQPGRFEIALTYDAMRSNAITESGFWLQGGSVQVHGQFWRGLGVVADVGGLHSGNINSSGVGLDLITATFGVRYTFTPLPEHGRYSIYAQGLAGVANGRNSLFPNAAGAQNSATGIAEQAGSGLNVALSHHIALRAFEANWVRTDLPNGTNNVQNNLRLGAGLAFRF